MEGQCSYTGRDKLEPHIIFKDNVHDNVHVAEDGLITIGVCAMNKKVSLSTCVSWYRVYSDIPTDTSQANAEYSLSSVLSPVY